MQTTETLAPNSGTQSLASPTRPVFTVRQFAERNSAFSESALRNLIHKADTRHSTRGDVPGNGLAEAGAIIRVGRKVLIENRDSLPGSMAKQKAPARRGVAVMFNAPLANDNARGQAGESQKFYDAIKQRNFTSYPAHGTQPARLLAAMLCGQQINPLAGWRQLGIYRLADTAFQLRGMGWPVITGTLEVRNRFGEKCRVAEYRLDSEAIAASGTDGQEFARHERELREVA